MDTKLEELNEKLNLSQKENCKLRAENARLNVVYQLAVAECVKACGERDVHRRNWINTMEHRDRLSGELTHAQEAVESAMKIIEYGKEIGCVFKEDTFRNQTIYTRMADAWLSAHTKETK